MMKRTGINNVASTIVMFGGKVFPENFIFFGKFSVIIFGKISDIFPT